LSTTVLQGSVATCVNDGGIFNDFFLANLLLSVMVKEFWRSVRILQSYGKKYSGIFFPDTVYIVSIFSMRRKHYLLRRQVVKVAKLSSLR